MGAFAQAKSSSSQPTSAPPDVRILDSSRIQVDTASKSHHSPRLAALMSAIVPGTGQVYNRKYWKVPLVYGGFATGLYFNRVLDKRYKLFKDEYSRVADNPLLAKQASSDTLILIKDFGFYPLSMVKEERDRYRRLRDITTISLTVWYLMNVLDAAVDAYFFDYEMSDDLSLHIEPSGYFLDRKNYYAMLNMRITF